MSTPQATPPAGPTFPVAKIIANVEAFRKSLPAPLQADFDKTMQDLAAIAEEDLDKAIEGTAKQALGGFIGGIAAGRVAKVVNVAIEAGVKDIETGVVPQG